MNWRAALFIDLVMYGQRRTCWRVLFLPCSTYSVTNASLCGSTGRRAALSAAPWSQRRFTNGGTEPHLHICRFIDWYRAFGCRAYELVINVIPCGRQEPLSNVLHFIDHLWTVPCRKDTHIAVVFLYYQHIQTLLSTHFWITLPPLYLTLFIFLILI